MDSLVYSRCLFTIIVALSDFAFRAPGIRHKIDKIAKLEISTHAGIGELRKVVSSVSTASTRITHEIGELENLDTEAGVVDITNVSSNERVNVSRSNRSTNGAFQTGRVKKIAGMALAEHTSSDGVETWCAGEAQQPDLPDLQPTLCEGSSEGHGLARWREAPHGIPLCSEKNLESAMGDFLAWGRTIEGEADSDGAWIKFGKVYLPMQLGGIHLLSKMAGSQWRNVGSEAVQVFREANLGSGSATEEWVQPEQRITALSVQEVNGSRVLALGPDRFVSIGGNSGDGVYFVRLDALPEGLIDDNRKYITVVGCGIAGIVTALELAARPEVGQVTIMDREETCAAGTSGRIAAEMMFYNFERELFNKGEHSWQMNQQKILNAHASASTSAWGKMYKMYTNNARAKGERIKVVCGKDCLYGVIYEWSPKGAPVVFENWPKTGRSVLLKGDVLAEVPGQTPDALYGIVKGWEFEQEGIRDANVQKFMKAMLSPVINSKKQGASGTIELVFQRGGDVRALDPYQAAFFDAAAEKLQDLLRIYPELCEAIITPYCCSMHPAVVEANKQVFVQHDGYISEGAVLHRETMTVVAAKLKCKLIGFQCAGFYHAGPPTREAVEIIFKDKSKIVVDVENTWTSFKDEGWRYDCKGYTGQFMSRDPGMGMAEVFMSTNTSRNTKSKGGPDNPTEFEIWSPQEAERFLPTYIAGDTVHGAAVNRERSGFVRTEDLGRVFTGIMNARGHRFILDAEYTSSVLLDNGQIVLEYTQMTHIWQTQNNVKRLTSFQYGPRGHHASHGVVICTGATAKAVQGIDRDVAKQLIPAFGNIVVGPPDIVPQEERRMGVILEEFHMYLRSTKDGRLAVGGGVWMSGGTDDQVRALPYKEMTFPVAEIWGISGDDYMRQGAIGRWLVDQPETLRQGGARPLSYFGNFPLIKMHPWAPVVFNSGGGVNGFSISWKSGEIASDLVLHKKVQDTTGPLWQDQAYAEMNAKPAGKYVTTSEWMVLRDGVLVYLQKKKTKPVGSLVEGIVYGSTVDNIWFELKGLDGSKGYALIHDHGSQDVLVPIDNGVL